MPKHTTLSSLAFRAKDFVVLTSSSDINALILDYLTMEGYPEAAANFSKEANLQPQQDDSSIRQRQQIQNFIHKGEIQDAIDALNELDPEVRLHTSPDLCYVCTGCEDYNLSCTTHMAYVPLMIQ